MSFLKVSRHHRVGEADRRARLTAHVDSHRGTAGWPPCSDDRQGPWGIVERSSARKTSSVGIQVEKDLNYFFVV